MKAPEVSSKRLLDTKTTPRWPKKFIQASVHKAGKAGFKKNQHRPKFVWRVQKRKGTAQSVLIHVAWVGVLLVCAGVLLQSVARSVLAVSRPLKLRGLSAIPHQ